MNIQGTKKLQNASITDTHEITTDGSDLQRCLNTDHVVRVVSNDVFDTLAVLGIEAARHVLRSEIQKVLSFDGSYVQSRHLDVLVDWMTWAVPSRPPPDMESKPQTYNHHSNVPPLNNRSKSFTMQHAHKPQTNSMEYHKKLSWASKPTLEHTLIPLSPTLNMKTHGTKTKKTRPRRRMLAQ